MRFLALSAFLISGVAYPESFERQAQEPPPAEAFFQKGEKLFHQNDFDNALIFYGRAAKTFREQALWKGYVKSMAGRAFSLMRLRHWEEARAVLDSARMAGDKSVGASAEMATVYYVYGVLHDFTNNPDRALALHGEGLAMRKKLLGERHFDVSESYNGIGEVYRYTLGDYTKAEKNFRLSLDILERIPDVDRIYLYRAYYNLATTNRLKNDFEKALGYGFKAIETLESIKPADTLAFIRCYGIIANIYNNQDATGKAISFYRKALKLRLARGETTAEMANDYKNLAQAYIVTSDFPRALNCVDSALMIIQKNAAYDSAGKANIYLMKGRALRESNRHQEALENYNKSLAILVRYSRSNALDISNIFFHLSQTMASSGQFDSALAYVQKSIVLATGYLPELAYGANPPLQVLERRPQLYKELAHKGSVLMKLAEKSKSVSSFLQALECFTFSDKLMDLHWGSQDRENSRLHFIGNNYYVYEEALNCIYELCHLTRDDRYMELAFQMMDQSKARLLRLDLEEVRQHARQEIPDSLLSQERTIRSRIAALQNKLGSRGKDAGWDSTERVLNNEMLLREKELDQWKEKIRAQFPNYTSESPHIPAMSLKALQENLAGEALFLEYFFGEEFLYVFASMDGQQHFMRIGNTGLRDRIYRFCSLLSEGLQTRSLNADFSEYTALASGLYQDLLLPVIRAYGLSEGEPLRQLLIVPDGALNLLPFQALITNKPSETLAVDYQSLDYLVRHYAISYSYDAASLFALGHRTQWGKDLLAFGWSDGEQMQPTGSLPGTYRELQSIGNIRSGRFRMGKEASKNDFVELAPDYSILHLAVHGAADDHDIYNNYLQFQDEKLYAHELYGFHLNANLTVLSACETGYGRVFNAEGVYSLARGFFHAGSKSLLMTLWRINDQSTASLMERFYENLDRGERLTSAIHRSQLSYLANADQYTAHPSYWAGLVLWGGHREVDDNTFFTTAVYMAVPALLFLIAMGALMRYFIHPSSSRSRSRRRIS